MRYILILFLFSNCTYYLYKDPTPFKLTESEKDIFNGKRILYIGFDLLEIRRISVRGILYKDKVVTNKEHLKIIEFLNSKIIDTSTTYFQKNYLAGKGSDTIEEGFFKPGSEFSNFGLKVDTINQLNKVENANIDDENLKKFLINYLKKTKHLGLDKMNSVISVNENQVKFGIQDFDYIILGIGKENQIVNSKMEIGTIIGVLYLNIISIGTLGIVPAYLDSEVQTNLYLYDRKLNLRKKSESETLVPSLNAIWMIFFTNWREYDKEAYKSEISRFLKESVDEIKK